MSHKLCYKVSQVDGNSTTFKCFLQKNISSILSRHSDLKERLKNELPFNLSSSVTEWAQMSTPIFPGNRIVTLPSRIDCNLKSRLGSISHHILSNPISVICSPTGAGKSVIMPAAVMMAIQNANTIFPATTGFRGLHLVPSAEQAHQNAKYVYQSYIPFGLFVGAHSSGLSQIGRSQNSLSTDPDTFTNYLYTTPFFADHAFTDGSSYFHVVVVDEIHEFSPNLIWILSRIKNMLRNGMIWRVVLLSATIADHLMNLLNDYFGDSASINVLNCGDTPHHITVVQAGADGYSQSALRLSDGLYDPDTLYTQEALSSSITPDMERLTSRVIHIAHELVKPHLDSVHFPENMGIVVFLHGASDVISAAQSFRKMLNTELRNHKFIDVYHITGHDRSDLHVLQEVAFRNTLRVVFTTPVLTTGATLIGISYVIDSGTVKISSLPNRIGITQLSVYWEDEPSKQQRKGRVGRIIPGSVYEAFSPPRGIEISQYELWNFEQGLQSKYTTSDLVSMLQIEFPLIFYPKQESWNELLYIAGVMGFFRIDYQLKLPIAPDTIFPVIDNVGKALSYAFRGISFDIGQFLILCSAHCVLLPGVVFAASILIKHAATKQPSGEDGEAGRNSGSLPINYFSKFCNVTRTSDIHIYTELIVNLLLHGPARSKMGRNDVYERNKVILPEELLAKCSPGGTDELWRAVCSLAAGLKTIGLINFHDDLFDFPQSGLFSTMIERYRIYLLDEKSSLKFNYCLVAAFGHHTLALSPPETIPENAYHTWYELPDGFDNTFCPPNSADGSFKSIRLVQGERAIKSTAGCAVYHNIFRHTHHEQFFTALFHQCQPAQILLHGNIYGSANDFIDEENGTLAITTNTYSVYFVFEDRELLRLIAKYRKIQKYLSGATLLRSNQQFASIRDEIVDTNRWTTFKHTDLQVILIEDDGRYVPEHSTFSTLFHQQSRYYAEMPPFEEL